MHQFSKIAAVAGLAGFGLIAAGFAAAPSGREVPAAEFQTFLEAEPAKRIETAFAASARAETSLATSAALTSSGKGDLPVKAGCAGQYWPYIQSGCLIFSDGRANPAGRTVTVGYQVGETASVLIRMPAQQIASR